MRLNTVCALAIFVLSLHYKLANAVDFRFTNLNCESHDKSFVKFEQCDLKVQRRGRITLNVNAKLFQLPVESNITLNIGLMKRESGYRPFLYNYTLNLCEFFKNQKRILPLKFLVDALKDVSNINHTCPYNHDIIVKDMYLRAEHFKLIPLPTGDYLIYLKIRVKNVWVCSINVFMSLKWV